MLVLSGVTCKYLSLAYLPPKKHLFKKKVKKVTASKAPLLLLFSAKPIPYIAGNNSPRKVSLSNWAEVCTKKAFPTPSVNPPMLNSYRFRNSQTILFAAHVAVSERTCPLPAYLIFSLKFSTSILALDHHNHKLLRTDKRNLTTSATGMTCITLAFIYLLFEKRTILSLLI